MPEGSIIEQVASKLFSYSYGKSVEQAKLEELRKRRKEFIENRELMGGPPFDHLQTMQVLAEMGLEEAEYIPDFEPDLLVCSPMQYKKFANISAGVPINPDNAHSSVDTQGLQSVQPPLAKRFGDYQIEVTYSHSTDRMFLLDTTDMRMGWEV